MSASNNLFEWKALNSLFSFWTRSREIKKGNIGFIGWHQMDDSINYLLLILLET
jgi:hypothetical protein